MCGRFVAANDPEGLSRLLMVDERKAPDLEASYNVAPTDLVYAVAEHRERRHLVALRWGLVPGWAKDARIGSKLINARSESAAAKPAFRTAFRKRRCLIPADGFYEWQRLPDGRRLPHYVHRPDGTPLAFAGLWSVWRDPADPEAPPLRTCTVLTTRANRLVSRLHDRMPAVLEADAWGRWLDRDVQDSAEVEALLAPIDSASLTLHPVGTEVNSPRHNHAGLVAPVPSPAA